ncbi:MAG: bifunctional UDP-N-acetylglucosamine diphosphorylase/glucosamine-1-phosphate N-acetyltransferase GlmU [SAR202 cluster bacterium]|nr:bifunctional UDP-N-acetylglucosamine diphosphorylase/glucosamine-1-phosphate N-acetyltransferase GlmU [SAR202 cluster bacterium]
MNEPVVVLAAGKGTRMHSSLPKVLHPVCGKPMISYVLDVAESVSNTEIIVVVPKENGHIKDVVGNTVSYSIQEEPVGTGDALLSARRLLDGHNNVIVMSGDVPLVPTELISTLIAKHHETHACVTLITADVEDTDGLGRVVRNPDGSISKIVEHDDASVDELGITEINAGIYLFDTSWLWDVLTRVPKSKSGEVYLTSLIDYAATDNKTVSTVKADNEYEVLGVNNQIQLSVAEGYMREKINMAFMLNGVTIPDPKSVYIDSDVVISSGTTINPNTHILGKSKISARSEIGPNTVIKNVVVGKECKIESSYISDSNVENGVSIGPFSNIRANTLLGSNVRVGNFVEIKNSKVAENTRILHHSYIGDAEIGKNVNIGAGSITCNFDGSRKNYTEIGDSAFIGSSTMMVAPVKIGIGAKTGAGSVITSDVPDGVSVMGVPARIKK